MDQWTQERPGTAWDRFPHSARVPPRCGGNDSSHDRSRPNAVIAWSVVLVETSPGMSQHDNSEQRATLPFAGRVHRQFNWGAAPQPRIAAAAFSIAITAAFLSVLEQGPLIERETRAHEVIVWLPPVLPAVRGSPVRGNPPGHAGRAAGKAHTAPRSIQEPDSGHPPEWSEPPASAIHLEGASAPLRLRLSNTYARRDKSGIRSIAERSRTSLGDKPASEQDRWSKAVESAGKPDCLAPNEHGSLLSVFVLAFDAARGKCR